MIKTVKHYVQPDVRNLMGLESGSPLCTSIPTYNDGGSLGDDFNESGYFEESDFYYY